MSAKTILIVDDEVAIVAILKEILQNEGYSVVTAHNGLEAIEYLTNMKNIDLMIIDYCMPLANGTQVIEAMRKNPSYLKTPAIMITGSERSNNIFPLDSAYHEVVEKPFDIDEIIKTVKRLLGDLSEATKT